MSLTSNDVTLLTNSWNQLSKLGLQEIGLAVLHRHMTDVPHVRALFYHRIMPKEMELLKENMRKEEKITSLAHSVAASIAKIIQLLEMPDDLVAYLKEMGVSHQGHSVPAKEFDHMGPVLLAVIRESLGDGASDDVMESWTKAYGAIKAGITSAM